MARKYWDEQFHIWKTWVKNDPSEKNIPWGGLAFPKEKNESGKWSWGNCLPTFQILPEPYWGNADEPSVVFININPGHVQDIHSPQARYEKLVDWEYSQIAQENKLNLSSTQKWHAKRFNWAKEIDDDIDVKKGLSVELIPWHSKASADVTKYILSNKKAVVENLKLFAKKLPNKGIFKNTFIVRSATFMDLVDNRDFACYFDLTNLKHYSLARVGTINKPISFLSILKFKDEFDATEFLVFHGGPSNHMPPPEYSVLGTSFNLKAFLKQRGV